MYRCCWMEAENMTTSDENATLLPTVPVLAGTHHVRLPVRDVERSVAWYSDLLGYERDFPFNDGERVLGWALKHSAGGPALALIHDPVRAASGAGFAYFAFGMPDEQAIQALCLRLDARGISHGGVQKALAGIKLPFVEDPDGHHLGFYKIGPRDSE